MATGKAQAVLETRKALANAPAGKSLGGRRERRAYTRARARAGRKPRDGMTGAARVAAWGFQANSILRVQAERLGMPWGTVQNRMSLCARLNREQAAACGVEPHEWATMTRKERGVLGALARVRESQ